jgi:hypothetical protein
VVFEDRVDRSDLGRGSCADGPIFWAASLVTSE